MGVRSFGCHLPGPTCRTGMSTHPHLRLPYLSQKNLLTSSRAVMASARREAVRPSHSASLSWPFPAMPYHAQCCLTRCHGHPPPCAREMILIFSKYVELLKNVVEHLSKTLVAQTIDGKLNCWCHLQISPKKGISELEKDKPCIKRCKVGTYN